MTIELRPFDAAEYFDCPEAIAGYLEAALESGDPAEFTAALGVVARAKGMAEIARDAGLTRPALYRSLSAQGRPEFETVLDSFGLALHVAVSDLADDAAPRQREEEGPRKEDADLSRR